MQVYYLTVETGSGVRVDQLEAAFVKLQHQVPAPAPDPFHLPIHDALFDLRTVVKMRYSKTKLQLEFHLCESVYGYDWAIVLLTILGLQNIPKQKLYDHYDIHVMTIHNL